MLNRFCDGGMYREYVAGGYGKGVKGSDEWVVEVTGRGKPRRVLGTCLEWSGRFQWLLELGMGKGRMWGRGVSSRFVVLSRALSRVKGWR